MVQALSEAFCKCSLIYCLQQTCEIDTVVNPNLETEAERLSKLPKAISQEMAELELNLGRLATEFFISLFNH